MSDEVKSSDGASSGSGGMDRRGLMVGAAALGIGGLAAGAFGQSGETSAVSPKRLAVVWSSADPDVAERVCLMYTHAAKRIGWFDEVTLIVWGPSQRTLVGDKDLRAKIGEMQTDGVVTRACVVCADSFGVADELRELGFSVEPMGGPLSEMLKDAATVVLTF